MDGLRFLELGLKYKDEDGGDISGKVLFFIEGIIEPRRRLLSEGATSKVPHRDYQETYLTDLCSVLQLVKRSLLAGKVEDAKTEMAG